MRQAFLIAPALLMASPALACAVCGAGEDRAGSSYIVMSIVISLLPLLMLGGIIGLVVLKSRPKN